MLPTTPSTHRPTPRRVLLLAALAATTLLGACGASSSSEGGSTTTLPGGGDEVTTTVGADESTTTTASSTTTKPSTTTEPDGSGAGDADRQAYLDAFAKGFGDEDNAPFEADQLECLANNFLDAIGVDELKSAGVTPEEYGGGGNFGGKLTLDEDTANDVFDQYEVCDVDLKSYLKTFAASFSGGKLTPEEEACIDKSLTDENLRTSLVADLMDEELENDPLDPIEECVDFTADGPASGPTASSVVPPDRGN